MSSVTKPVGGGLFTYTLSVVPDAPPDMTIYSDPLRTIVAEGPTTLVATGNPSVFTASYSNALAAGQYYLGFVFLCNGTPTADNNDTLLLVDPSGDVGGPCMSWPLSDECPEIPVEASQALIDQMTEVSQSLLYAGSGYRYGLCSVTIRPCLRRCFGGVGWTPYKGSDGEWINVLTCGCVESCACSELCEVVLPGPVAEIISVRVGAEVLLESSYRVDTVNGQYRLVRTDGGCWPSCQDLAGDCGDEDTFCVTYFKGIPLNDLAILAHTELTSELVRSCIPDCQCRLPKNVVAVTRQGVTLTFDNSRSWLRVLPIVAAFLDTSNPYSLSSPSSVWSPDVSTPRVTL